MQFRVIVITDPLTNKHTHRQDRLQYTVPQLSVQCNKSVCMLAHTTYRDASWRLPYVYTVHMPWQTKISRACACMGSVQHSPTQSLQCPGVMPGLGYLGMAYGPIQRPVHSGMKQALNPLWTTEYVCMCKHEDDDADAPWYCLDVSARLLYAALGDVRGSLPAMSEWVHEHTLHWTVPAATHDTNTSTMPTAWHDQFGSAVAWHGLSKWVKLLLLITRLLTLTLTLTVISQSSPWP